MCAVAPSAPDNLNVDKITKEQGKPVVQLSWTKPRNDGGAKITDFVIEQKTPEGEWIPIKTVPEKETSAKVTPYCQQKSIFTVMRKHGRPVTMKTGRAH